MTIAPCLPVGTQVVVDMSGEGSVRGVVGRVVQDRGAVFVVALGDGRVVDAIPERLRALREYPPPNVAAPPDATTLVTEHAVYAAVIGPAAMGFGGLGAEVEIRAVYQAPTDTFWSLRKPPGYVDGPGAGWSSWEVERFCELALEADPTCLDLLWTSHRVWVDDAGHELLDLRGAFLSQLVAPAYAVHALAGFKKLEESAMDERRWARAAYHLRLLMDGTALLRGGDVAGTDDEHCDRLLAVWSGQETWANVDAWRLELQKRLEEAAASTFHPAVPDADRVAAWLDHLRRRDAASASQR